MTTFNSLRNANEVRHIEWTPENISLSYRGNELAGETGEACNVIKKLERERLGFKGSRSTKEQLAEELADVVICADLVAMDAGIDLGQAVVEKFNKTSEKYGLDTHMVRWTPPEPHQGLLQYMMQGNEVGADVAKDVFGIYRLPNRIMELKAAGYRVNTRYECKDGKKFAFHRIAA